MSTHVRSSIYWCVTLLKINCSNYVNCCIELLAVKSNTKTSEAAGNIHRGSYMSAHVLLNLLNELGERDKMGGLPSILSLFRNEFNKLKNTRARILDSIYHMTNTLKSHFWRKKRYNFVIMYATLLWTSKRVPKIDKPLVVYRFYCMALFHSQTRRHMINAFLKCFG